ncbi:MAG: hypothetical protein HYT50_02285 [Candidatus Wildermuthbacteria bacterium]|nr:hypothetical protein [Candidatus Wildermuthbacteria bacterium]
MREDIFSLIRDEVNVKEIAHKANLAQDVELDTVLTPELKEEGMVREIMRKIQEMRKGAGYKPKDKISLQYAGDEMFSMIMGKHEKAFMQALGIAKIGQGVQERAVFDIRAELAIDGKALALAIKRAS